MMKIAKAMFWIGMASLVASICFFSFLADPSLMQFNVAVTLGSVFLTVCLALESLCLYFTLKGDGKRWMEEHHKDKDDLPKAH